MIKNIIIVVVLLILTVFTGSNFLDFNNANKFIFQEGGFEFSYPSGWELKKESTAPLRSLSGSVVVTPGNISSNVVDEIIETIDGNISDFNPEKIESEFIYITYGLYSNTEKENINDVMRKTAETQLFLKNNDTFNVIEEKISSVDDKNIYYIDYEEPRFNIKGRVFVLTSQINFGEDKKSEVRYVIHYVANKNKFSSENQNFMIDSFKLNYTAEYLNQLKNDINILKSKINKASEINDELRQRRKEVESTSLDNNSTSQTIPTSVLIDEAPTNLVINGPRTINTGEMGEWIVTYDTSLPLDTIVSVNWGTTKGIEFSPHYQTVLTSSQKKVEFFYEFVDPELSQVTFSVKYPNSSKKVEKTITIDVKYAGDISNAGVIAEQIISLSKQARVYKESGNQASSAEILNQAMLLANQLEKDVSINKEALSKISDIKISILTARDSYSYQEVYFSDIERITGYLIDILNRSN